MKMFSYKKFIHLFVLFFTVFLLYHFTIWELYTSQIFGRKDNLYVGDLGRTSYQVDSLYPRALEYTLPKRHLSRADFHGQKIDMITMGDSFANADTGGKNPYFQDYIATDYNLTILNMRREPMNEYNSYNFVLYLYNSGWLQKHRPKYILIQSVGRFIYGRYARKFDFSFHKKPKYFIELLKKENSYLPKLKLINTANYKFFTSKLYYRFKGVYKSVYLLDLNTSLFSPQKFQNKLLITKEDISGISNAPSQAELVNENFNKLARLLKKLDIKLIFFPAIDKYDLYEPYITNNKLPKNNFFKNIRPLYKEYYFVDTKKILRKALQRGDQDIFYPDDTHWSYKASALIAKEMNNIFNAKKTLHEY